VDKVEVLGFDIRYEVSTAVRFILRSSGFTKSTTKRKQIIIVSYSYVGTTLPR
jgi:hypothetical protein